MIFVRNVVIGLEDVNLEINASLKYDRFIWKLKMISFSEGGRIVCFELISNNKITIKRGMAVTNLSASKDPKCTKVKAKLSIQLNADLIPSIYNASGSCSGALNYVVASYDASLFSGVDARTLENMTFDILATDTIPSSGSRTVYEKALADDGTRQDYLIIFYIDGNKANDDIDSKNIIVKANVTAVQTN